MAERFEVRLRRMPLRWVGPRAPFTAGADASLSPDECNVLADLVEAASRIIDNCEAIGNDPGKTDYVVNGDDLLALASSKRRLDALSGPGGEG
jgi:hypothetical protein